MSIYDGSYRDSCMIRHAVEADMRHSGLIGSYSARLIAQELN